MCTLLVAHRLYPDYPLVVAANRDEKLDRPAGPPRGWTDLPLRVFAPEDLEAGGTWLGINEAGLFAGLTNRFAHGPNPGQLAPDRRSRGLLVLDALEEPSAAAAFARLKELRGDEHNPFHLVVADGERAFLVWSDGRELSSKELAPGRLHSVTERSYGAAPSGRVRALHGWQPKLQELGPALKVHRGEPFDSTCVHVPDWNYGTRSSTWILYGAEGPERFSWADGPPCETPWDDVTPQMTAALSA
jgi:uncharacterized protein with NRDE domain